MSKEVDLAALLRDRLFTSDLTSTSPEQLIEIWVALNTINSAISFRKDQIEETMRNFLSQQGNKEDNKVSLESPSGKASLSIQTAKQLDAEFIVQELEEEGIDPTLVMSKTEVYVLDPSKLKSLVSKGKIPAYVLEESVRTKEVFNIYPKTRLKKRYKEQLPNSLKDKDEDD